MTRRRQEMPDSEREMLHSDPKWKLASQDATRGNNERERVRQRERVPEQKPLCGVMMDEGVGGVHLN